MLPIVKYPNVICYFSKYFRDVFEHKGQYTSFTVFAKILLLANRSIVSIIF